ncbi:ABC transporter permease subunit [Methanobacterium alkalithermotolerans]|uniref:ABC transporter permease subunit n=1 Tax=Methanobacterium alkalithermotolerans TaxID=2731220 RepID=A0A8T8K3E2_9EURY|nr:ABC transporter permease subunit [Methanobacterium alkalithermotolerans]QUH22497.1 ABC transporter permease subunit [Methanobacterium alkalithermotolerans]RJS49428.1 MAG: ABC transporter permease [Methanobacterium sp.]
MIFKKESRSGSLRIKFNLQSIAVILIFLALLAFTWIKPSGAEFEEGRILFTGLIIIILALFALELFRSSTKYDKVNDIFLLVGLILAVWEIVSWFSIIDPNLLPSSEKVFSVYAQDYEVIITGIFSSLFLLITGYLLAIVTAIPLGLIIGWKKRLYNVAYPTAKAMGPIPPTVYIPYAIALLPSFFVSSVFVIFIGAFWPILVGVVGGVFNIDHRLINSARTLGLSDRTILWKVLLPGAAPSIFQGALIGLIISFITLMVAEIIGSSSGLGWYLQSQGQFANYGAVLAGMIVVSLVVIAVTTVFDQVQEYVLRWQRLN